METCVEIISAAVDNVMLLLMKVFLERPVFMHRSQSGGHDLQSISNCVALC